MTDATSNAIKPLSLRAVGIALSTTLVVLYVGCFLSVLFLPMLPLSHQWLSLFTAAWPMSVAGLIQGLVINIVVGWLAAAAYVLTYNAVARRQ